MQGAEAEEKIKLAIQSAKVKGLGKIDEAELKKELANYFGAEGTGYTIGGDNSFGWSIAIIENDVDYFINATGSMEKIDNSKSLISALVDDLGTRSTIYLYNNTANITDGTITITLPDNTTETITAIADTSNITSTDNYYPYTVSKNGIYTFTASDGTNEAETKVIVNNIEKFTSIETLASQEGLSYAGGKTNAYTYKGAAVPKGYYVDTRSEVNTGLVVTDDVDSEGYSTGNEWVWVPVNSTVGNDDYYGEESEAIALAGATSVTYTKYSKLYSFMDKTREDYGRFYSYKTTSATLSRPSTTSTPGYREIAILTDNSYGETMKYNLVNNRTTGVAFSNVTDLATQYRDDYDKMVASVDNYNGFYIGRYEITENGEIPGDSLVNIDWYTLYNQCIALGKTNTESGMIYGCLWDTLMQWFANSGISVGYTGDNPNLTSGYGNYASVAVIVGLDEVNITIKPIGNFVPGPNYYTGGRVLKTGQSSYTRKNNIYDLSGNCEEWTQEAYSTSDRILRGGRFTGYNNGVVETTAAGRSIGLPTGVSDSRSSRPYLYVR